MYSVESRLPFIRLKTETIYSYDDIAEAEGHT